MKFNLFAILILLFVVTGCAHKTVATSSLKSQDFFDPGKYNGKRNLTIRMLGTECGEWGGHEEKIIVTSDSQQVFHANYLVYSYSCDTAYNIGYDPHTKLIKDTVILLDTLKQRSIIKYIYQLLEVKVSEKRLPYACNFSVVNSDSSLLVATKVCNPPSEYYRQLLSELALKNYR